MLNLIRMILLLGFIVFLPSISETKIKIYGHDLKIDQRFRVGNEFNPIRTKQYSVSFFEIIDEIFSSNVTNYSKIKATNEALRLTKMLNMKTLRDNCYQSVELDENVKCLEMGLKQLRKNKLFVKTEVAQDIILGSCMKMETYSDEGACLENLISKINIENVQAKAEDCSFEASSLQKVFCLRSFL